jgi:hypothetical protein
MAFVCSSWIRALRTVQPYKLCDKNWVSVSQHSLIQRLAQANGVQCLIAASPEGDDDWYGYVVGEPSRRVLHWAYTKGRFRRGGVAGQLLTAMFGGSDEEIEVTFESPDLKWIKRRLVPQTYRLCEVLR